MDGISIHDFYKRSGRYFIRRIFPLFSVFLWIRPKFEALISIMEEDLGGLDIAEWTNPKGGYFIGFDSMPGCAKEIVAKMKEAGVILTGAGATFPYHIDPQDRNIRLAPTFPTIDELKLASRVFTVCVRLVSAEKLLAEKA